MHKNPPAEEAWLRWKQHTEQLEEQSWPQACLYVVATPIGNLADLSLRALETLRRCELIAAEDTRSSKKLLQAWGIGTPLMAAHRHNEAGAAQAIIARLQEGARIALISDAGAPAVSDPGARIVGAVRDAGFRVIPIPGASAVIAAIMASGATSDENPGFVFAGFVPSKAQQRRDWLARFAALPMAVLMFESPHRLQASLAELQAIAGDTRVISIARELTKRFEQISSMPLAEAGAWLAADPHHGQGEFVLLLHPPSAQAAPSGLGAEHQRMLRALLEEMSLRDAVKIAAKASGLPRDLLYQWALENKPRIAQH